MMTLTAMPENENQRDEPQAQSGDAAGSRSEMRKFQRSGHILVGQCARLSRNRIIHRLFIVGLTLVSQQTLAARFLYPNVCGLYLSTKGPSSLPHSTLKMAKKQNFKITRRVKVITFKDLPLLKGREGFRFFKKASGSLFMFHPKYGNILVSENDTDSPVEIDVLQRSDVMGDAKEVLTLQAVGRPDAKGERADRPSDKFIVGSFDQVDPLEVGREVHRFAGEIKTSENPYQRYLGIEVIHSHPFFDFVNGEGQALTFFPSDADLQSGIDMSNGSFKGALVFMTIVLPNGYHYTAAFSDGKNVTDDAF
jgi:hypothetical protein